jgi:erythromycin esterase
VRKNAVKFRSIDPDDTDFDDLQPLKAMIGDAQIVQLGEQSHGDGTCFETKIRLIKFLHQEMGFDVLAFESGIYDCHKAWEFFEKGHDAGDAARLGVFGIWTGSKQTQPLWNYLGEQFQTERPLELAGFDCQFTAGASRAFLIEDLKALVAQFDLKSFSGDDSDLVVKQLESALTQEVTIVEGASEAIDRLIQELSRLKQSSSDSEFWMQNLKSIQAYIAYKAGDRKGMQGVQDRDAQMARNLIWMHQKQFPNRKIIVWAASFHVMRNPPGIEVPGKTVDYSEVVQMGHAVDDALGSKVFTIAFTANDGAAGTYFRQPFGIGEAPEGTLENIFSQAEIENGILALNPTDAGGKWLLQKQFSRPLGYSWMKAKWGEHFDAMVFNREMKPSTR